MATKLLRSSVVDCAIFRNLPHHIDDSLKIADRCQITQCRQRHNFICQTSYNTPANYQLVTSRNTRYFSVSTTSFSHDESDEYQTSARRRRTLKCGRARRKWEARQGGAGDLFSFDPRKVNANNEMGNKNSVTEQRAPSSETDDDENNTAKETSVSEMLFGKPLEHPLREAYIRSQSVRYPRTLKGWKIVLAETWKDYLWTLEGSILKEKKRDADGNIIESDKNENDEDTNKDDENSLKEKVSDTANDIASNVQKNVSVIQKESPKLLQLGQDLTGISSKEELRKWIGEQLKLATECLSEFMKGYRAGRDDEVDKMLHKYFKELDGQHEESGHANTKDGEDGTSGVDGQKQERRLWGRRERRRKKVLAGKPDSLGIGENAAM